MAFGFIQTLAQMLAAVWTFLFQSFTHYDQVLQDITRIHTAAVNIKNLFRHEAELIKNFEFNPQWNNRVIHVPTLFERVRDLKEEILDTFSGAAGRITEPVHELLLVFREEAIEKGDPQQAVSALAKAEVKLGHLVTMIHQIAGVMEEIEAFGDLVDRLRNDASTLEDIFLPQGRRRKTLNLSDGGQIKVRLGNLHPE